MSRFMFVARYASDGAKGIVSAGGTSRRSAIEKMAAGLGGRVESFDFAFGEDDVYTILDLPDHRAAAAMALAVNSSGKVSVRTIVLITPEEVDAAASQTVSYTPPGA